MRQRQVGVPIAGVQKTTLRTFVGNGEEENEGLRPRILWGFVANFPWRQFVVWSLPVTRGRKRRRATMAVSFKGAHFPKDIILMGVRWYVAYPLSYRHVEELMEERGVEVDHS